MGTTCRKRAVCVCVFVCLCGRCLGEVAALGVPECVWLFAATSSVDSDTDAFIQRMIRRELTNCTVLTIAHRLNTIMDSDKIVVLDQGYMREEGAPDALNAAGGFFSELCKAAASH